MPITAQNKTTTLIRGGDGIARSYDTNGEFVSQLGKQVVTLHPTQNTTINTPTLVQFGFPFPRNECISAVDVKVQTVNGIDIPCYIEKTLNWENFDGSALKFVRSVSITIETTFTNTVDTQQVVVVYGEGSSPTPLSVQNATSTWVNYRTSGIQWGTFDNIDAARRPAYDYDGTGYGEPLEVIMEPATWATLPQLYIRQCEVFTPYISEGGSNNSDDIETFLEFYRESSKSMTNELGVHVTEPNMNPYMTSNGAEIGGVEEGYTAWLFDRATAVYSMYGLTGDLKWLIQGHRAATFYESKLTDGYLTLKTSVNDPKYSYIQPMMIDTQLCGNTDLLQQVPDILLLHDTFEHDYQFLTGGTKLFTERHAAYKLGAYVSAFEVTGDGSYATQAQDIVNSLYNLQQTPVNGWAKDGSIRHTLNAHESFGGDIPIGSPWMASLLSNELLRYYRHSGDVKALTIMQDLGTWIINHGWRTYDYGVGIGVLKLPWYLASDSFGSSNGVNGTDDIYNDVSHAFDVASLMARAAWAQKRLGNDNTAAVNLYNDFMATAAYKFRDLHRTGQETIDAGKTVWRLAPTRIYNWWFTAGTYIIGLQERF